jgi:uncharacterized linocin/CFP29 family protein
MGRLVSVLIEDVAGRGLFLSMGAHNLELVVGRDLATAYAGNEGLDHRFRVLETLVLRVKRLGAICRLGG